MKVVRNIARFLIPLALLWGFGYLGGEILPDGWQNDAWYAIPLIVTEAGLIFLMVGIAAVKLERWW